MRQSMLITIALSLLLASRVCQGQGLPASTPTADAKYPDPKYNGAAQLALRQWADGAEELRRVYIYDRYGVCSYNPTSICSDAGRTPDSQIMMDMAAAPDRYSSMNPSDTGGFIPVGPPFNETSCNTVSALAVVGAAETAVAAVLRKDAGVVALSEQDLFFCSPGGASRTCSNSSSWTLKEALDALTTSQPVSRSCLPYNPGTPSSPPSQVNRCQKKCTTLDPAAAQGSFGYVPINNAYEAEAHIRKYGSVIAQIDPYNDLLALSGGDAEAVYRPSAGSRLVQGAAAAAAAAAGHSVLLVGYDHAARQPYWVARNSWGSSWGNKGFFKIAMDAAGALAPWNLAYGVTWTPNKPDFPLPVTCATTSDPKMTDCWLYKAKQGDNLSKIAWLSGISIGSLLRDNRGPLPRMDPFAIPGKSLLLCNVPALSPPPAPPAPAVPGTTAAAAAPTADITVAANAARPAPVNTTTTSLTTPTSNTTTAAGAPAAPANNSSSSSLQPGASTGTGNSTTPPQQQLPAALPHVDANHSSTTNAATPITAATSSSPRPSVPVPSPAPVPPPPEVSVSVALNVSNAKPSSEAAALLALKASIDTAGSALLEWQAAAAGQICSWRGISCNGVGKVASILLSTDSKQNRTAALSNSSLTGTLPSAAVLAPLTELTQMVFADSPGLVGSLPEDWNQLTQLQVLQIFNTSVSGSLPEVWGDLTKLLVLRLWGNRLTGTLPPAWSQFGGKLMLLDLAGNKLNGALPVSWAGMRNLAYLNLFGNSLSSMLPAEWGALDELQLMDLGNNPDVTGDLPAQWSSLSRLTHLRLARCSIIGTLPSRWSALASLQQLYLFNNALTGPLPESWDNMHKLQELVLSSNQLTGAVPESWGYGMTSLKQLALRGNEGLEGCLPWQWANVTAPGAMTLDLSGTEITGVC